MTEEKSNEKSMADAKTLGAIYAAASKRIGDAKIPSILEQCVKTAEEGYAEHIYRMDDLSYGPFVYICDKLRSLGYFLRMDPNDDDNDDDDDGNKRIKEKDDVNRRTLTMKEYFKLADDGVVLSHHLIISWEPKHNHRTNK
jgi:hypothetical protein